MSNLDSARYFLPEIILAGGAVFIVLFDLVAGRRKLAPYFTLWILAVALFISVNMFLRGADCILFEGLIRLNGFTLFFKLLFGFTAFLTVLFSLPRQRAHQGVEYYVLLLISVLGLFTLASANDLLMIYLGLETVSICSYLLVASPKWAMKSSEAGLKYVIYGAVASGIMLYGMAFLYGLSGTTSLNKLFEYICQLYYGDLLLYFSLLMVLVGFGYKIAAVPFHMWCPDVYEGAPTEITAFLSVAPKAAGFAVLINFFFGVFSIMKGTVFAAEWKMILAVISVLTMTFGNLAALHQTNLKRLLAYSSIAHSGYILMGLAVMTPDGIEAMMFYLPIYLFMNMGAFFAVYVIEGVTGRVEIGEYQGLGWRIPLVGFLMAMFLFSLIGLPPFAGFIGKFYLFASVINAQWYVFALIGLMNGVISLYYYARIIRAMWLRMPEENQKGFIWVELSLFDLVLLCILAVPILIFGVWWTPLIQFVRLAVGG